MDKVRAKVFNSRGLSVFCGKRRRSKKSNKKIWERIIPLSKATRDWDVDFWQAQKPEVRFRATWNMVVDFYRIRGKKVSGNTLRLQRFVENLKQTRG